MTLAASCAVGLERVLSGELERLDIRMEGRSPGRIQFGADGQGLARALICSRIADRIFVQAGRFPARDFDQLFEGCRAIEWERWVGRDDRLVIEKARSLRSTLAAQNALQSVTLKAAYERLGRLYGTSVMPETAREVQARIRIEDDIALVEIDLCGLALSKRGYRKTPTEAPLKETVAAGLLFLAGWKRSYPLYDPFCGSGTIAIEAALYGLDIAPGLLGRTYAWEAMPSGSSKLVQEAKERAREAVHPERDILIAGSDIAESALKAAKANAGLAKLDDRIRFFRADAKDAAPFAGKGYIITDPPYGKRLGSPEEADALYSSLGTFVERFSAWQQCWVVDREDFALPGAGRSKRSKIVDGAETRWFHRFMAGTEPIADADGPTGRRSREYARGTRDQGKTGPKRR